MSGGQFDYNQHILREIADELELELEEQGKKKPDEELYMDKNFYKEYPEERNYPEYTEETNRQIKKAIRLLRTSYIYVQRIDWLLSGDDGEESFLDRLDEDLKGFNKSDYKGKPKDSIREFNINMVVSNPDNEISEEELTNSFLVWADTEDLECGGIIKEIEKDE